MIFSQTRLTKSTGRKGKMDIADAIKSVGEAFTSLFNWLRTNKEEQSETQLIKDKKRLKSAANIAEEIFDITDKYKDFFDANDTENYDKLRKKFDKKD